MRSRRRDRRESEQRPARIMPSDEEWQVGRREHSTVAQKQYFALGYRVVRPQRILHARQGDVAGAEVPVIVRAPQAQLVDVAGDGGVGDGE